MKFESIAHEVIYKKIMNLISEDPNIFANVEENTNAKNLELQKELAIMDLNRDNPAHKNLTSHRKVLGSPIIFGKKVVRRLLKWYLNPITQQQSTFNTSSTKAIISIYSILEDLNSKIENVKMISSENANKQNTFELNYEQRLSLLEQSFNEKLNLIESNFNKIIHEQKIFLEMNNESNGIISTKMTEVEEKYNSILIHTGYEENNKENFFEKMTYSQSGEDGILAYILLMLGIPIEEVTYVDLGANHAKEMSNTYYFYRKGAKGVLVEANEKLLPELKLYRNKDIILHNVVDTEEGNKVTFYILNGDGLSTPDFEAAEKFCEINPDLEIVDKIEVETITYNSIVEKYLQTAPTILSIDIEGKDLEILNTIDFDNYRPMLIVAEMIEYSKTLNSNSKNNTIKEFLHSKGYDEYAYTGINSIFIDKSRLEV
ncbi:FkbM family methyltransferase [Solibacillus sp. FSL W8-0474]|uniref:FkbM family methyltransferase n=1 Tax=Solibacillus sp. FSL W8-0474 TaxID=2975336 RepID=UPI0030F4DDA2